MEQSTASHHLNILKKAGLAKATRQGKQMIYSINATAFRQLYDEFLELLNL